MRLVAIPPVALALISCAPADVPADAISSPSLEPASAMIDACGNELRADDDGARRLYVSVAPHIYASPPYWEDMATDERKAWAASIEELLSYSTCPADELK